MWYPMVIKCPGCFNCRVLRLMRRSMRKLFKTKRSHEKQEKLKQGSVSRKFFRGKLSIEEHCAQGPVWATAEHAGLRIRKTPALLWTHPRQHWACLHGPSLTVVMAASEWRWRGPLETVQPQLHLSRIACLSKGNVETRFSMTFLCCFFIFLAFEIVCCSGHSCLECMYLEWNSFSQPKMWVTFSGLLDQSCQGPFYYREHQAYRAFLWESKISWDLPFRHLRPQPTQGRTQPVNKLHLDWPFCTKTSPKLQNCYTYIGQGYWDVARVEMSQILNSSNVTFCVFQDSQSWGLSHGLHWQIPITGSVRICFVVPTRMKSA